MPDIVVRLAKIEKSFGPTRVLKAIDLDFSAGEVHAIVGENGAGKSTVGKIIGGYYSFDGGRLEVFGEPVASWTPRRALQRGIAMIHQELQLVPALSVADNVNRGRSNNAAGRRCRGTAKQNSRKVWQLLISKGSVVSAMARSPDPVICSWPRCVVRPNPSSWRLTKQRSSVLAVMCAASRSTVCLVAFTSETWTGAASLRVIAPSKGWSATLRGSSRTKAAARSSAQLPKG